MAPKMGIDPVILRLFNTFGPGQTLTPYVGVITIFIKNILKNKISKILGNGKQQRDFVYIDDVVRGFILTIESKKAGIKIFNIGFNPKSDNERVLLYSLDYITNMAADLFLMNLKK